MENIGRYLALGGIALTIAGGGLYLAGKLGLPLGHLPGDNRIEGDGGGFYFPIVTSIVVSVILTVLLNLFIRFLHR